MIRCLNLRDIRIIMPEKNDVFFIGIKEPALSRRLMLECVKDVIKSLQKYEKFRLIRKKEIESLFELKNIINEIDMLNLQLKGALPKTKLRIVPKKKNVKEEPIKKHEIAEHKKKLHKTEHKIIYRKPSELEKLESELNDIESKLDNLKA